MSRVEEVVVIATGGTISMKEPTKGAGATPSLAGKELVSNLQSLEENRIKISIKEYAALPSAFFAMENLWELAEIIRQMHDKDQRRAFVVTMGTDILEEFVYFLDLLKPDGAAVVVTGAMRSASQIGYEGEANLHHAILCAASPGVAGAGALLVMNEEIHGAREVQKTHATNPATFASPGWGPLGWMVEGKAMFRRLPVNRRRIAGRPPFPNIQLVRCTAGMDTSFIDYCLSADVDGLVVEAFGVGHVSPEVARSISRVIEAGVAVVVTTRCHTGSALEQTYGFEGSESDLLHRGVTMAKGITGPKARIKLILALSADGGREELTDLFNLDGMGIPDLQ